MSQQDRVFSFLQNRILTHYPAARMLLDGEMPAPRTAIVYPTYVCNQNCLWCEYAEDNRIHHNMMPAERLRKLIWDLKDLGVRGVEFCGGGEPTLHPVLPELIREMKAGGVSVGLLTNGTMLRGELASATVDCISYVRVGFDSARPETFNKVKRPNSRQAGFDAVCENVAGLVALREERATNVRISMKTIVSADNYTELEDCVKLALELRVDSIQFKAARMCATELNAEQTAQVTRRIEELRQHHIGVSIIGSVDKVNMKRQCWLTPIQIMVDTFGDVFLCCYYRHRKESHCFGNAFDEPLHDVWYSQRHWDAINAIKPAECNLLDCRFVAYNDVMSELLLENDAQFEFI